jgi:integrase
MNYAVKYYNLPKNPCWVAGGVGKSKADEMSIWTVEEFETFIEYEDKPAVKLAFDILFWTGMREGELLSLTPSDILPDKSISITKTFTRIDNNDVISDPKTPKSRRIVPIPEFLYNEIQAYLNSIYDIQSDERIFYFTMQLLNAEIKRVAKLANIKQIRVHDLRHSHASMLIQQGYSALLVSERLGHENIETTLNTYSHLYPNEHRNLAQKLDNLRPKQ